MQIYTNHTQGLTFTHVNNSVEVSLRGNIVAEMPVSEFENFLREGNSWAARKKRFERRQWKPQEIA